VALRKKEIEALALSDGMVTIIVERAEEIVPKVKGFAPVSASGSHGRKQGYLRANIRTRYARDAQGVFADVVTQARTPNGFPYGRRQEQLKPYMKKAIE